MTTMILRHLLLSGLGVGAIFALALGLRLLARHDAVLRYRLMVGALLAAVALVPIQVLTAELAPQPSHPATLFAIAGASRASPLTAPAPAFRPAVAPFKSSGTLLPPVAVASRNTMGIGSALVVSYLVGLALVLVFHAVRAAAARRLLSRARPVTDPRVRRVWDQLVSGLRRPPELLECDSLHAPACRALGRAAVILPAASGALDQDTLLASLQHELVHLRRRDGVVALLATGLTALLWFQPLIWVFVRLLAADREHSCDALVVRATGRPRSYALALLRFCDPGTPARRAVPLMGFESARSIRRRINMLAHAPHPAPRRRRACVVAFGFAGLAATSVAHALLTVVAGPGAALSTEPPARSADASTSAPAAKHGEQPAVGMTAELRAPAGRANAQIYQRLRAAGAFGPGAPYQAPKSDALGFFPGDEKFASPPPGTWATDQETVISAERARTVGDTLQADSIRLSLPEGSGLRAVLEGRTVALELGAKDRGRIAVLRGTIRIVDDSGVTRALFRAVSNHDDATLTLTSTTEAGVPHFKLTADDGFLPVSVRLDTSTGLPEGEAQPPHGAVRWKLLAPPDATGISELKMQWIYDLSRLPPPDGC